MVLTLCKLLIDIVILSFEKKYKPTQRLVLKITNARKRKQTKQTQAKQNKMSELVAQGLRKMGVRKTHLVMAGLVPKEEGKDTGGINEWVVGKLCTIKDENDKGHDPACAEFYGRSGMIVRIMEPFDKTKYAARYVFYIQLDTLGEGVAPIIETCYGHNGYGGLKVAPIQKVLRTFHNFKKKGSEIPSWRVRFIEVYPDCIRYRKKAHDPQILGRRPFSSCTEFLEINQGISLNMFAIGGCPGKHGFGFKYGPTVKDVIWFCYDTDRIFNLKKEILEQTEKMRKAGTLPTYESVAPRKSYNVPNEDQVEEVVDEGVAGDDVVKTTEVEDEKEKAKATNDDAEA